MADVKFTIDNSSLLDKNGNIDRSHLGDFNRQVNYFKRALESATGGLIRVTSVIDAETGLASANFYVPSEYSSNALSTLKNAVAKARSLYSYLDKKHNFTISRTLQQDVTFYKNYVGKDAQQKAMKEIAELGGVGVLKPTHKNKNRMQFTVPVDKDVYKAMVQALGSKSKANAYFRKMALSAMGGAGSLSAFQQGENAEKDKQQAEKEQAKEEEKRELRKQKEYKAVFNAVNAGILRVADIARRILSAVLTNVTERAKEARDSVALGVSASSVRQYKTAEKVTGLAEGTFTGAIGSLQSAFGDISNLDDKALRELAKVLQGSVISAVNAGLGKNNPEQLMSEILNAYFKRGQSGVNSLGMQVGKYEAQRELATALEKAGLSDLAQILRSMFFNANEGIYKGQINNFEDFKNIMTTYTAGNTPADYAVAGEVGQSLEALKAKLGLFTKNIETKLLVSLENVVHKLNSMNVGKSAEEVSDDRASTFKKYDKVREEQKRQLEVNRQAMRNALASEGLTFSDIYSGGYDLFNTKMIENKGDFTAFMGKKQAEKFARFLKTEAGQVFTRALIQAGTNQSEIAFATAEIEKGSTAFDATRFSEAYEQSTVAEQLKKASNGEKVSNAGIALTARTRAAFNVGSDTYNKVLMSHLKRQYGGDLNVEKLHNITADDKVWKNLVEKYIQTHGNSKFKLRRSDNATEVLNKFLADPNHAKMNEKNFIAFYTSMASGAVNPAIRTVGTEVLSKKWSNLAIVEERLMAEMGGFISQNKGKAMSINMSDYNARTGTIDVNVNVTDANGKTVTEKATLSFDKMSGLDNFEATTINLDASGNLE